MKGFSDKSETTRRTIKYVTMFVVLMLVLNYTKTPFTVATIGAVTLAILDMYSPVVITKCD